jgi:hypothetical protein
MMKENARFTAIIYRGQIAEIGEFSTNGEVRRLADCDKTITKVTKMVDDVEFTILSTGESNEHWLLLF